MTQHGAVQQARKELLGAGWSQPFQVVLTAYQAATSRLCSGQPNVVFDGLGQGTRHFMQARTRCRTAPKPSHAFTHHKRILLPKQL
jgi:hypothetical protein